MHSKLHLHRSSSTSPPATAPSPSPYIFHYPLKSSLLPCFEFESIRQRSSPQPYPPPPNLGWLSLEMAAEVGPIAGYVKGYDEDKHRRSIGNDYALHEKPITRDLLGGLHGIESQELDLDLQVPLGWEKRLDLKSGKVYLQRCSPTSSSSSSGERLRANQAVSKFQDLNSPPSPSKSPLSLLDDSNLLDLKLTSSPVPRSSCGGYQSVCTLDKVKSALEKAEREPARKRPPFWRSSPSSSSSAASNSSPSSSSVVDIQFKKEDLTSSSAVAAGCPCCLLYVLIPKSNPKCPRCNAMVPMPTSKRPRIDLNMSV